MNRVVPFMEEKRRNGRKAYSVPGVLVNRVRKVFESDFWTTFCLKYLRTKISESEFDPITIGIALFFKN